MKMENSTKRPSETTKRRGARGGGDDARLGLRGAVIFGDCDVPIGRDGARLYHASSTGGKRPVRAIPSTPAPVDAPARSAVKCAIFACAAAWVR